MQIFAYKSQNLFEIQPSVFAVATNIMLKFKNDCELTSWHIQF